MKQRMPRTTWSRPERLRPRVLYFSRIDFPSPKANSIQSLNTCYAMACQGAEVRFVVRRLLQPRRECFAYYGLQEHPRLRFVSLSLPFQSEFNDWQGRTFRFYLGAFLRRQRRATTILVTRDAAGLELLRLCGAYGLAAGIRTLFEVHKLAFLTKAGHQEERGRSLADPVVRAKVEARRALEAEIYAAVDGIVCTSDGARAALDEHFPQHAPLCVIPNGARIARDRDGAPRVVADLDDAGRDLDILYVGQLYRWKGVDGLLQALCHLPGRRLTLVGGNDPEDLARLRDLAAALGVAPRVDFVGQVAPHAVASYTSRARVGVIPLPGTGFVEALRFTSPLKAFELMQAGVPLVATDLPSVREIVRHGQHGLLVPPDDPAALAQGIDTLLGDRALASKLVRAAAAHVQGFSWEARARRILDFASTPADAVAQAAGA
jgi:glycosyltransferase involved in cell wall biosynthesis